MEITIDKMDLQELKDKIEDLAKWLTENFTNFNVSALILSAVLEKIDEIEEAFSREGDNVNE